MGRYSYKDIWKVSYPIMLGLLAQNIVQLTATIFLGWVGEVEQSAAGLAGIYYIAFFTICFGFSIGGQIMISRRNGEQNFDKIGTIVIQGVIFLEVLAMILVLGSMLGAKFLLPQFLQSVDVYEAVMAYLSWRVYGFFFSAINVMFRAFYVGIARTKVLTMNAIVMSLVNVIADYTLIFGKFGFPEMGIEGAGIAALIAEFSSVLFFVIYTCKKIDFKKYGFTKMKFRWSVIRNILNISSFTMVQYLISMFTWFAFFIAMEQHSERALAVTNIVRNFYMIFFIPMNAFATAANTLVGNTMGMGMVKEVVPLIKRVCKLSLCVIVVVMAITAAGAEKWISFIASHEDMTLVTDSIAPLFVVICVLPICNLGTVAFNSISGTGNTRDALILELVTLVVYVVYMYWIAIYRQSSVAVSWTVELVYWGLLLIFSTLYLKYAKWQDKKV